MRRNYRKPILPTVEQVNAYLYEQDAADVRFCSFLRLLRNGTSAGTAEIGRLLGVSRMTIYAWARLVQRNQPLHNRGRRRKYKGQASLALSLRIPHEAAGAILGQYDKVGPAERALIRKVCERILVRELGLQAGQAAAGLSGGRA